MFEFRLRILDARERERDPFSFLGIVEGFPEILVHATTVEQAERDLVNALAVHLTRLMDHEATRIDWDDYPTVRWIRLDLGLSIDRVAYPTPSATRTMAPRT